MDHRDRIQHVINRESTDIFPVAFWRHFPVDDQDPFLLARSTVDFQKTFDFDFVKVSPASSFCLRDWGMDDVWKGNPEGTRDYLSPIIKEPKDWKDLKVLNPHQGYLSKQLECLKIVKKELPVDTPIIQTIFSPISQAKNLVGKNNILNHIRSYPQEITTGLEIITQSTTNFIEECIRLKIDGIFFAEQFATYDLLTSEEFLNFGKYFDEKLFPVIEKFWLNVIHIHGKNIMFDQLVDFPMHVFNWHDQETPPDIETGQKLISGAVCGGISINTITLNDPENIIKIIKKNLEKIEPTGFILGSGCVLPLITPHGNIRTAIDCIRNHSF